MNRIKNYLAVGAFALLVLGVPAVASAQWGNGGYGNGGNRGYNRDIRGAVESLKHQARSFEQATNRAEDRDDYGRGGGWGNRRGGDVGRLEDLADQFKKAADKLEDKYDDRRDLNKSRDAAQRVLNLASQIDNEIYQARNRNLQNQWNQIRNNLNVIASAYGQGGYNRGRNGSWRNRLPF